MIKYPKEKELLPRESMIHITDEGILHDQLYKQAFNDALKEVRELNKDKKVVVDRVEAKGHIRCIHWKDRGDAFLLYQEGKMSKGKLCELIAQALSDNIDKIVRYE